MNVSQEIFIRRHFRPDLGAPATQCSDGEPSREELEHDSSIAPRIVYLPRMKGCKEDKEDDKDDKGLEKNDKGTRDAAGAPGGPVSDNCYADSWASDDLDCVTCVESPDPVHVSVFT